MLCKEADDKSYLLNGLTELMPLADARTRKNIERELAIIKAGIKAEKEAAYLIDFYLANSKNTAVLHDLRIELPDGRVAQIDHLLIHKSYRFYLLETKHVAHGVKITDDGEFLRWDPWKKTFVGMASPIEQGKRHAHVMLEALKLIGLGEPVIRNLVVVSADARVDRPKNFDTSNVVKADQVIKTLDHDLENANVFGLAAGLIKSDPLINVAEYVIGLHRPISIDFAAKFGIKVGDQPELSSNTVEQTPIGIPPERDPDSEQTCHKCKSTKVRIESGRYGYYFKCEDCEGNTPIKLTCQQAGHSERLRKSGLDFFRECKECGSSDLYFQNSA